MLAVIQCARVACTFGRFTLNSETRQLVADGVDVHLSPKAFDLLVMLVSERARALSKAELQERLWPTTFVSETNLAALVAEIRRALGDRSTDSAFIRTVHRFGYRFVADVHEPAPARPVAMSEVSMYVSHASRDYTLAQGVNVIGRAADAAVRVDSGSVSRQHAQIVVAGGDARVEDLGSKNGTFVDGKRVTTPQPLSDGAEIRVGAVALIFRVTARARATETLDGAP